MAKNERLPYIDVAKGLLILMVIWGHYELMLRLCFKINDPVIDRFDSVETLWVSFFMPAFFFITGFCSSFNKPFRIFAWNTMRIIFVPAVIINYSIFFFQYLYWGFSFEWVVKTMVKNFIHYGTNEWFLTTLFLSRLIVWIILRIRQSYMQFLIVISSLFAGVALYDYCPYLPEIWSYKHTLMMLIFLWTGARCKTFKCPPPRLSVIYPILLSILIILHIPVPYITNRVGVPFGLTPILALSGTLMILQISKLIKVNQLLQWLGKNSLIIYLVHFLFYQIYLSLASGWFNQSVWISTMLFFGVVIINIASCCLVARLINTPYFRWIIGK